MKKNKKDDLFKLFDKAFNPNIKLVASSGVLSGELVHESMPMRFRVKFKTREKPLEFECKVPRILQGKTKVNKIKI